MKKDKLKLITLVTTLTLILLTTGLWAYNMLTGGLIKIPIVLIILIVFGVVIGYKVLRNLFSKAEKGLPLEDERSQKIMLLASSKAFVISIWYILILGWLDLPFRDYQQATGASIIGMAIIFGLSWLYYNNKGM